MNDKSNILVVAAHPDDEVLGCGGTIKRLSSEGHNVYTAILGEGITSRDGLNKDEKESKVEQLKEAAKEAGRLLGTEETFMYNLPDNRFDTVPILEIVKRIESLITKIRPEIIYTHSGSDLNIDHQLTFRAVLTAARPVPGSSVKTIYVFETLSSTEWSFGHISPAFCPDTFINIENQLDAKINALRLYKTEIRQFPHPRSVEAVQAIAARHGSNAGLKAAEAFELVRDIII